MFGGYLRSQVRCNKCKYNSNTYDPFLDLSLEVSHKKANSIAAAFSQFTRKETLDEQNRWKCSGCKRYVCATKQLTVFRPPLSLCIQLKRFAFGGGGYGFHGGGGFGHFSLKGMGMMRGGSKISKQIEFPATMKLPLSDGRKCEYSLTGVIIHIGGSATSGHYTAFVKKPAPMGKYQWHHMDDSYVTAVSEKTVLSQKNAYVLFYCRKEVKLELPTPPPRPISNAEHAIKVGAARARARSNSINTGEEPIEHCKKNKKDSLEGKSSTDKPTLTPKTKTRDGGNTSSNGRTNVVPGLLENRCDSNPKQKPSNNSTAQKNTVTPIHISPMVDERGTSTVSSINSKASVHSSISGETMKSLHSLNPSESDSSGSTSDDSSSSDSSSSSDKSNSSSSSNGGKGNNDLNSISKKLYPYSGKEASSSGIEDNKEQKTGPPKVLSVSDNSTGKNLEPFDKNILSKSPQKKEVSLNLGSNRGTVKVSRKIKRKAWKPDASFNKSREGSLLGNRSISKWDDDEDADSFLKRKENKIREDMLKEDKEKEKSKRRKMYLGHWDRALDEGKVSLHASGRLIITFSTVKYHYLHCCYGRRRR